MPGLTSGWPDRAEEDCVERLEFLHRPLGQDLSRLQVAVTAEIEGLVLIVEAFQLRQALEDLEALPHYLGAGSVSRYDRYLVHRPFLFLACAYRLQVIDYRA